MAIVSPSSWVPCVVSPLSGLSLVDVAPGPAFPWLDVTDDRVLGLVEVLGRVPVRRGIAASHVSARQTESQLNPCRADLQAVLTALGRRRDFANLTHVFAARHACSRVLLPCR